MGGGKKRGAGAMAGAMDGFQAPFAPGFPMAAPAMAE